MIRKNKAVQSYSAQSPNRFYAYVYLLLLALLALYMAWRVYQDHHLEFAVPFGFLILLLVFMIFWVGRVYDTVIEIHPGGVAYVRKNAPAVFIKWEDIADIKDGSGGFYANGSLSAGLVLQGRDRKTRIIAPYLIQNYFGLRERILARWSREKLAPGLPLVCRFFPFFNLTLVKDGLRYREGFKTRALSWGQIAHVQWGQYYLLSPNGRVLSFILVTPKDGSSFRVHGWFVSLIRPYMVMMKVLSKGRWETAPNLAVVTDEKWIKSLWFSALSAVGMALLPGFYMGKVIGHYSNFSEAVVLGLLVLGLYALAVWSFLRQGKVSNPNESTKTTQALAWAVPLAVFATCFILAGSLCRLAGEKYLEGIKNEARAAGYNMDAPKNSPKLKDAENAVYYIDQSREVPSAKNIFFVKWDNVPPEFKKLYYQKNNESDFLGLFQRHLFEGGLTREEISLAHKLIQEHKDSLRLVEKAYQIQKVDFGLNFSLPDYQIEYPSLGSYLTLTRLLIDQAYFQSRAGQASHAITSLKTALFIGNVSQQTKSLIGEMVAVAVYQSVLRSSAFILENADPALIQKQFLPALNDKGLYDGYMASLQYRLLGANRWKEKTKMAFYSPFVSWDMAIYYQSQIRILETLNLPASKRKEACEKAAAQAKDEDWFWGGMAEPRADSMLNRVLEAQAYCRMARAATQTRLFYRQNKRWPDALWQLSGLKDALDPFSDGANLRVMRYGDGILIYSLGPDGVDNQGLPKGFDTEPKGGYNPSWIVEK